MAISVTQEPNVWNLAYAKNVFTLSGLDTINDPAGTAVKYALSVNIIDGGASESTVFQQPANPAGVAHFDVSKILQSYLSTKFVEETEFASETIGETFSYFVKFGYVLDTGVVVDNQQIPARKRVINGYDTWRTLNWDDSQFNPEATILACESTTGSTVRWPSKDFLTNYPNDSYPLRNSQYHTLSFFNGLKNIDDGTNWDGTSAHPAYAVFKFYTSNDSLIQTSIYSIDETTGLGPRTTFDSNTLGTFTDDMRVGTIGAGPQNLKDAGIWPSNGPQAQIWGQITQVYGSNTNIWNLGSTSSGAVAYYTVDVYSVDQCYWNANGAPTENTAAELQNYLGTSIYNFKFNVADPCSNFDAINVSFMNQYGVRDYFTFDRRNTRQLTINRNNYHEVLGSWSDASFSIDSHGRGRKTFSTDITEQMTLSSYWMNDATSKWLEELFTSPSIEVYVDGQWEPAIIASNTYEQKTYARDRMFQHTIGITFANDKKVQRG